MTRLTTQSLRYTQPRPRTYRLSDGCGLALQVLPNGTKAWRFRYRFDRREKMISLGLYPAVPIEAARRLRDEARDTLKRGTDPSAARRERKHLETQTFRAIVDQWLDKLSKDVGRGKLAPATLQRSRWLLTKYFAPTFGRRPIRLIQPSEVLVIVKQIELRGLRNTPRRALQKCGQLFRYAAGIGAAERDITQDLAGLLERVPTEHHAGITDPRRLGQLLRSIDCVDSHSAVGMALRLAPLVFLRPIELVTAEWDHIDFNSAEWRIPTERMKMRQPHLVPLSRQALVILRAAESRSRGSRYVFPAARDAIRPMHAGAINSALRRLCYRHDEMTAHGFRTTACNLLAELGFGADAIELQLSHSLPGRLRRIYNHAQYVPERRQMMQAWADYLDRLRGRPTLDVALRLPQIHCMGEKSRGR
ncbi:MAG: integrase arm-type DNA-binding domain-containing protein [Gammaproteobacteria bacterium]